MKITITFDLDDDARREIGAMTGKTDLASRKDCELFYREAHDRLAKVIPQLMNELDRAADTFTDLAQTLSVLKHPTIARVARIARESIRVILKRMETPS